jgi:hypothetical protein
MVAIIPSLDLVIVRMGLKEDPDFDFNGFLKGGLGFEKKETNSKMERREGHKFFVSLCKTFRTLWFNNGNKNKITLSKLKTLKGLNYLKSSIILQIKANFNA